VWSCCRCFHRRDGSQSRAWISRHWSWFLVTLRLCFFFVWEQRKWWNLCEKMVWGGPVYIGKWMLLSCDHVGYLAVRKDGASARALVNGQRSASISMQKREIQLSSRCKRDSVFGRRGSEREPPRFWETETTFYIRKCQPFILNQAAHHFNLEFWYLQSVIIFKHYFFFNFKS
jgi:hypothetical protein